MVRSVIVLLLLLCNLPGRPAEHWRLAHIIGFMLLITVHTSTKVFNADEKYVFYDKLNSFLNRWLYRYRLIVLSSFNGTISIGVAYHELCASPLSSGTKNINSSLLNFTRCR